MTQPNLIFRDQRGPRYGLIWEHELLTEEFLSLNLTETRLYLLISCACTAGAEQESSGWGTQSP